MQDFSLHKINLILQGWVRGINNLTTSFYCLPPHPGADSINFGSRVESLIQSVKGLNIKKKTNLPPRKRNSASRLPSDSTETSTFLSLQPASLPCRYWTCQLPQSESQFLKINQSPSLFFLSLCLSLSSSPHRHPSTTTKEGLLLIVLLTNLSIKYQSDSTLKSYHCSLMQYLIVPLLEIYFLSDLFLFSG